MVFKDPTDERHHGPAQKFCSEKKQNWAISGHFRTKITFFAKIVIFLLARFFEISSQQLILSKNKINININNNIKPSVWYINNIILIIMFRCFAQILLGVVFVFVVIILGIFAALKGSPTLKVRNFTWNTCNFTWIMFLVNLWISDSYIRWPLFKNGYFHNKTRVLPIKSTPPSRTT